jgi:aminoglycoside phosphotransferase (APT) family kinase protein
MRASDISRAMEAGVATASAVGLTVDDAMVLHDSNRIVARLLPCDVVARVAYVAHQPADEVEVEIARRLAALGSPVAAPDPRVQPRAYLRDGFVVTFWTYYEPVPAEVAPPEYARALVRLHAGMRQVTMTAPHFTDRVAAARASLGDRTRTPELADADRELLDRTLRSLTAAITDRGADEQLLHGEPHPGNLLNTRAGSVFADFETCCRGPIEFDIAHAPEEVSQYCPSANVELLKECRILILAMITTWRWEREDQLPNGRHLATEWLTEMRTALADYGLDGGSLTAPGP